ncbi:MAG: septum formation initiator family protein [Candidatus Magasanikbacteria bacterium]|nr:septum formation initiator family protein [Candidatus Magasanikbacteria bacterium]
MKQNEQSSIGRFFASRTFLIIALIVVSFFAFGFARAYYQDYKVKQEIRALEDQVSSLEKKKIESIEILKYVKSDAYVENQARTELNMKEPGEHLVFLKDMDAELRSDSIGNREDAESGHFFSNTIKWVYYFLYKSNPS